jgi:hypothetical protein
VLLALSAQQWPLPDKPDFHDVMVVLILSSTFAEMVDVPGDIADLAAERIEWAIACIDKEYPEESESSAKWLMTHLIPEYSSVREIAELSRTALAETRLRHGSASLPFPPMASSLAGWRSAAGFAVIQVPGTPHVDLLKSLPALPDDPVEPVVFSGDPPPLVGD